MPYDLDDWLNDISEGVPGCSKTIINRETLNIIIDFCQETLLWNNIPLTPINIVAGTSEYLLNAPVGLSAVIVIPDRVEVNGKALDPTSMDFLDRDASVMWRQQTASEAGNFMVDSAKVLKFRYIPTESSTGGLVVWASLKPSMISTYVPDFIYDDWYDIIRYGVLGNIFKLPKQAWTNIREGEYFDGLYGEGRGKAKKQKRTGKTNISFRVQNPPFHVF